MSASLGRMECNAKLLDVEAWRNADTECACVFASGVVLYKGEENLEAVFGPGVSRSSWTSCKGDRTAPMLMRPEVWGAVRAFPFLQSGGSSVEIKVQEMQKSATGSHSYRLN